MSNSDVKGQRIQAKKFETPSQLTKSDGLNKAPTSESPARSLSQQRLTSGRQSRWWHSQLNLLLGVFALLGVAALLFVQLAPPPELTSDQRSAISERSVEPRAGTEDELAAPWDETRRAQARADSQDILSDLLERKKQLEAVDVQTWAPSRYQQILATAETGDDFYKQQDYAAAIDRYQTALTEIKTLYGELPKLVQSKIEAGLSAIEEGKSALAIESFSDALKLDPNSISAMAGLERANNLDQVLLLMQNVRDQEQLFLEQDDFQYLESAQQLLDEVLVLDENYKQAVGQQQKIASLKLDKQFRDAMSDGFDALFKARYSSANRAFLAALKIRPDDSMANNAYRQSLASTQTSSLQSLLNRAIEFERNEDWQNALSNYELLLQRDPNLVAARLGQIRSRARGQLDADLRGLLQDTLQLSKKGKSQEAQRLLGEARAITDKGPKLKQQITALEQGITIAAKDINVEFTSDSLTQVSLQKLGARNIALGRFSIRKLTLKPGRYVLTGIRVGYHDVRKEIEISPQNGSLQAFSIRCDKPISTAQKRDENQIDIVGRLYEQA